MISETNLLNSITDDEREQFKDKTIINCKNKLFSDSKDVIHAIDSKENIKQTLLNLIQTSILIIDKFERKTDD